MNRYHSFTYIIGYRHSNERLINLRRVLDWVSGFGAIEIILVEQDKHSKIKNISLKGVKHIFTKSEMPYNRSWAFNVGLKYATSDVIAFGDSDLIVDPQDFINSLKLLETYECVSPYRSVLDLNQNESSLSIDQMKLISRPGRGETDNQKINLCGGIVLYRKESIYKIGGWCEDFIGWGGEDNFQEHKTKNLLSWFESSNKCFHLWHERAQPDMKWYPRTLELLNKLVSLSPDDLKKNINLSLQKMGMKNKYDK